MPKFLVIYRMEYLWAESGPDSRIAIQSFDDVSSARSYMSNMMDAFDECAEIHLYEYTGIQYVLVERRVH